MKITQEELYKAIKIIQRAKIVSDKNIMELNSLVFKKFEKTKRNL